MKVYTDSLRRHTTMQLGGEAKIVELASDAEVEDFFNNIKKYNEEYDLNIKSDLSNIRILGGGSNMLVGEDVKDIVFVTLKAFAFFPSSNLGEGARRADEGGAGREGSVEEGVFSVWAGTSWDDFVMSTVEEGYKDLAYLSLIPGTVGAAPVQNIGAYGAEVKDTIKEVHGYDFKEKRWKTYTNAECDFAYRHSRFQEEKSFLITRVSFEFPPLSFGESNEGHPSFDGVRSIYPSLKNLINESSTAKEVREAVIQVRDSKLPRIPGPPQGGGDQSPSVGSFFHNPIVDNDIAIRLKIEHSDMPIYEYDTEHKKLSAGWLIEHAGCATIPDPTFHFYKNNHLVITHNGVSPLSKSYSNSMGYCWSVGGEGEAKLTNLLSYAEKIKDKVKERFGVELHIEPEIIN